MIQVLAAAARQYVAGRTFSGLSWLLAAVSAVEKADCSLAAPLPLGSSLTVALAIDLGSGTADPACHPSHPSHPPTVGGQALAARAERQWRDQRRPRPGRAHPLRHPQPESRKTVHLRDMF